ncbi:beta-glucan synthesis-associated protein-domain-containing protein [Rhodotorula diobovata]|uniref:Beta-glucan synthesis-associated protein-domain-containing protein n=1 Tax=Rhodotorula diobovata TaxID=5288 RepID=A0A5C5G441_9BASI|nr:beta-glucan synthesis-associated protein-domain-containing protein [Rhodotorula diobovata]
MSFDAQGSGSARSESSQGVRPESSLRTDSRASHLDEASFGVLNGTVGGLYSPFPEAFAPRRTSATLGTRRSSSCLLDPPSLPYSSSSFPIPDSPSSSSSAFELNPSSTAQSIPRLEGQSGSTTPGASWTSWEKEPDDFLHEVDPELERVMDKQMRARFSWFALLNTASLCIVVILIIGLFAAWPIWRFAIDGDWNRAEMQTITNSTGQVPKIPALPTLIDDATPREAYKRTGLDGDEYKLVFSDEFNHDGRTFWPGDDPYWEAVDLWYWGTRDLEWYDPDAITTRDGNLVITLDQTPTNNLNFRSGMLQSWNKFCFTGGYLEVRLSLPGEPDTQGFWPGVWTLGNLGRAGYGGTNDGVWPYTYDSCDVGTLPNQTWPNGTDPVAAKESGSRDYGGELSWLSGQRFSACTCEVDRDEHPGPDVAVGRGAPEIDALEGSIWRTGDRGSASQSTQVAPFTAGYGWLNTTPHVELNPDWTIRQNQWRGSINQESLSHEVMTDSTSFSGRGYTSYGFEYDPGPDGEIRWAINGSSTWTMRASAIGPDDAAQIGQRLVSEEPMSIVLNLAISYAFQEPQWGKLQFPGSLLIDYVRVYQKGDAKIGCDPKSHPTAKYIEDHMDMYTNPNISTFAESRYRKPRNRLSAQGCS